MVDQRLVERLCDFVLNIRSLGFNGADWRDIEAAIGEQGDATKAKLKAMLVESGATLHGKTWNFVDLKVDALRHYQEPKTPSYTVKQTFPTAGGRWEVDTNGRWHYVQTTGDKATSPKIENYQGGE
jgi:hypothetical protein